MRQLFRFVSLGLMCLPLAARAGLDVNMKVHGAEAVSGYEYYLDVKNVRINLVDAAGKPKSTLLFHTAENKVIMMTPEKKTYSVIDLGMASKLLKQNPAIAAMLQKNKANLPPELRAALGDGAAPKKFEYKKIGTKTVGKWKCTRYQTLQGGVDHGELCTVPLAEVGAKESDFAPFKTLTESLRTMLPGGAVPGLADWGVALERGFPVETVVKRIATDAGSREFRTELVSVGRSDRGAAYTQVPAGYTEKSAFQAK